MPQSLNCVIIHIVFSTKDRAPLISEAIEPELHAYLASICRSHGCNAYRVGGVQDHVHIVTSLGRTITISELVEKVKKASSKWMKTKGSTFSNFYWQSGYGVFSVSTTHLDDVIRYVTEQKKHHKTLSFQQEYLRILNKYGIEYDERYVWD